MKILLIHQYFLDSNDGGGSRFNEMTKIWAERGNKITVIAGMVHYASGKKHAKYKDKFIFKEIINENIEVVRCHVSEAYNKNFLGRLWAYFSFVISSCIAGIFNTKGRYDIVLATSPPLFVGITAYILSRLKKAKLVFEIRDLWPESAIDTGVLKNKFIIRFAFWFEKFVYQKSHLINTLTPAFQEIIVERKKIPSTKVIMIPNASDFSIVEESARNFDRNAFRKEKNWDNKLVIIYVGAHGIANHLIQVIEAAELLKYESNIHFVLIGDGMEKPKLIKEAEIRKLGNIEFIETQPKHKIFQYILASDIGLSVLKKNDTFKTVYSNKTFDYMACKKPILIAIDGVSRELIEQAQAGFFVEPENPNDLVEKLKIYLQQPELIKQHGENGYKFALTNFDRSVLAEKYLVEIQKLKYV